MGVKSTVELTRADAEERFVAQASAQTAEHWARIAASLPDRALEDVLEEMNDERVNRENGTRSGGFDNYSIIKGSDDA